ncbi:hypothetical protein GGQ10_003066 [Salinibacter ruber]|uniref:Uncharacterized protein n=1 Tax=Salinibacter ruber TaxID=146919 RepID=A0A9X3A8W8_9BACT|nr:hypothetical protein [Salinibacter ruber]MCS3639136.1 hypothetical protein [Salinibacter ruber]MCS4037929.1 hypothetical protein [Salinibacter ruber]MCS4054231.1 hypothetical protein [Salinibacter ruber]MCS4088219.1 hypothetical protein [Salinibacter ruber]
MVNRLFGISLLGGHVQCFEHQLGPQMACHRPADDSPTERVEYDRQVQIASVGRHVGDVRHPEFVGPGGREVTIDEVRSRPSPSSSNRRRRPLSAAYAAKAGFFHQASDSLFADADVFGPKLRACPTGPVGASRSVVYLPDSLG